jgi:predicted ATPase
MIYLKEISLLKEKVPAKSEYPFNIPTIKNLQTIELSSNVTFFVGENGSGKSTLIEAIGINSGFNVGGGSKDHSYLRKETESVLSNYIRLSWMPKAKHGFFLRAESFFNFASYIDEIAKDDPSVLRSYGGKSLHHQSHGESFLALFNRFQDGIFILDEPEAALSPSRQLSFMSLIHSLESKSQFIIATHSPILLAYPKAQVLNFSNGDIKTINYKETEHFDLYKRFIENPDRYLHYLFLNS